MQLLNWLPLLGSLTAVATAGLHRQLHPADGHSRSRPARSAYLQEKDYPGHGKALSGVHSASSKNRLVPEGQQAEVIVWPDNRFTASDATADLSDSTGGQDRIASPAEEITSIWPDNHPSPSNVPTGASDQVLTNSHVMHAETAPSKNRIANRADPSDGKLALPLPQPLPSNTHEVSLNDISPSKDSPVGHMQNSESLNSSFSSVNTPTSSIATATKKNLVKALIEVIDRAWRQRHDLNYSENNKTSAPAQVNGTRPTTNESLQVSRILEALVPTLVDSLNKTRAHNASGGGGRSFSRTGGEEDIINRIWNILKRLRPQQRQTIFDTIGAALSTAASNTGAAFSNAGAVISNAANTAGSIISDIPIVGTAVQAAATASNAVGAAVSNTASAVGAAVSNTAAAAVTTVTNTAAAAVTTVTTAVTGGSGRGHAADEWELNHTAWLEMLEKEFEEAVEGDQ